LTRADGSFELRDARPGVWRVIMSASDLPKEHVVDGDSVRVVDLARGGTAQLELRVIPRERRILPLDAPPDASRPAAPMPKSVSPAREPIVTPAIPKAEKLVVPAALPPVVVVANAVARAVAPKQITKVHRGQVRYSDPKAPVAPKRAIEISASAWPFVGRSSTKDSCVFSAALLPALATCRP
jgi:hypothetical protein